MGGLPIGVSLRTIRAEPGWWLESARRLDAAGYQGVWAWDHFMGRGDVTVPVVEGWTALAMAAGATSRIGVGSFVLNVMNRHPAVVARMSSTLQIASGGRFTLGIGIGGHPREHAAYGIDFPAAPERVARLEEAIAVIRALWTGGPVTRESPFYPLVDAAAFPVPVPAPRIILGGETAAGARLAGRIGDGWSAFDDNFEENLPLYLESLAASGRRREDQHRRGRVPGRLAGRCVARGVTLGHRPARDVAALAGGRRGRGDRPGPHDRGRGRAGGRRGALVGDAPGLSDAAHSPHDSTGHRHRGRWLIQSQGE